MPIGMMPDAKYKWHRCQVPPNSSLYLFSDGLYEVLQNNDQYLGLDAFIDLLTVARREKSVDYILQSVMHRQVNTTTNDDMSLMMIHID
jgi:sigma-B regulation protein RsbU (phosphoserine phosphatase)